MTDDTQYGSAANGVTYHGALVGSGYDAEVHRESDDTALVCVTEVGSRREWLAEMSVEADTDLQRLAIRIAQCPDLTSEEWAADDSDDWDYYADRWDAVVCASEV